MNFDQIQSVLDSETPDLKTLNEEVGLYFFRVGNTKEISTELAKVVVEKLLADPASKESLEEILTNTQAVSIPVCRFFVTEAQKQFPEGTPVLEGAVSSFLTNFVSNYSASELAEGILPVQSTLPAPAKDEKADATKTLATTEPEVLPKPEINALNASITTFVSAIHTFENNGVPKEEAWVLASSLDLSVTEPTKSLTLEMECVGELVDSVLDKRARLQFGLREPEEIGKVSHFGLIDRDPETVQATKDLATVKKFASELPSVKELAAEKKSLDSTVATHHFLAAESSEVSEGATVST